MYADDTQIYLSVCPVTDDGVSSAASKIVACADEVQNWMTRNFLKLNAEKTEVLLIGFRAQLAKCNLMSVHIAGAISLGPHQKCWGYVRICNEYECSSVQYC